MRFDVWWKADGNKYWRYIPGVEADSAMDAVQYVNDKYGILLGSHAYAYPRDTSSGFVLSLTGWRRFR